MEEREPLSLLLPMSRVAGLAPYDSVQRLRLSRPALLYSYLLHVALSTTTMCMMAHIDFSHLEYTNMALILNVAVLELTIWVAVIRGPKTLRDVLSVLTRVKKICRVVKYNDTKNAAQRTFRWMFVSMAWTSCVSILLMILLKLIKSDQHNIKLKKLPYAKVFFDVKCIIPLLLTTNFTFLGTKINCAMRAVNWALGQLVAELVPHDELEQKQINYPAVPKHIIYDVGFINVKPKMVATLDHCSALVRLRSSACTYVFACSMASELGNAAGLQLFLLLTFNILNIIQSIYFIIVNADLMQLDDFNGVVFVIMSVTSLFLYISKFILLVAPGHDLSEELENTRYLVCKLSCEASSCSDAFRAELAVFFIHLTNNQPRYTALGMCTLGRELTLTIAAFIATYLAILLGI